MSLSSAFVKFPELKTEENPPLPSFLPPSAFSLGIGLEAVGPFTDDCYICCDSFFDLEVLRGRLDECTDPNCPLLLSATYLTVEARREGVQKRRDTKRVDHEYLMKDLIQRREEMEKEQTDILRGVHEKSEALNMRERNLIEREDKLRERELRLEQLEGVAVGNESHKQPIDDMVAHQHNRTLQESQKDLPNGDPLIVEDGPNAFVPVSTPSLLNTSPATSPPTSPLPIASSPPSSPVQSPCHQPGIPSHDAAKPITYSCIMCTKADTHLMIGCQNCKECLSKKCALGLGGIDSGNDAWFHISHLRMTEAELNELTGSQAWYCPQCQPPLENTDSDNDTTNEPDSPQGRRPLDNTVNKFDGIKARRQAEMERRGQADTDNHQTPTTTKRRREAETPDPQTPTANKRRRRAQTPKPKESTESEKPRKQSNRRQQVLWTNPLERAALIDAMKIVIRAHDQREERYVTASEFMLGRGFDRSRYQIKNKWTRAVRDEAQRQGVMMSITGAQTSADIKRRRLEKRRVELGMVEMGTEKLVEQMGE